MSVEPNAVAAAIAKIAKIANRLQVTPDVNVKQIVAIDDELVIFLTNGQSLVAKVTKFGRPRPELSGITNVDAF